MSEVLLFGPRHGSFDQRDVCQASNRCHVVMATEERLEADYSTARPHLLLEVVNQSANRLYQLLLALSERDLLMFNVVNFILILFHELLIAFGEERKCSRSFLIISTFAVNLRPDKPILDSLQLCLKLVVDRLNSLAFLHETSWCS